MATLPLEDVIEQGVEQLFREVFTITNTLITSSTDKNRLINEYSKATTGQEVIYPVAFLTPTLFELNLESYSPKKAARHGVYGKLNSASDTLTNTKVLPVKTSYEITLLTPDRTYLKKFMSKWLFAGINNTLGFTVDYDGSTFDIVVAVDPSMSIPQKDNTLDIVNQFELVTNMIVQGYISGGSREVSLLNQKIKPTFSVNPIP